MAHGDISTGVARIRFVDEPKSEKGPWRIKTDMAGGVPEHLKHWDRPACNPGDTCEITAKEEHREYQGKNYVDYMVKNLVVHESNGQPAAAPSALGGGESNDRRQKSIVTQTMIKAASWQLGPGATLAEVENRVVLLIEMHDNIVKYGTTVGGSKEAAPGAAPAEAHDDTVPF